MHGRGRGWLGWIAASAVALVLPGIAQAGGVEGGLSTGITNGAYRSTVGSYDWALRAPVGPVHIDPREDMARTTGEGAYADVSPAAWPHDPVQGWLVVVDFTNSAFGANWQGMVCRTPASNANGLCDGAVTVWDGVHPVVFAMNGPDDRARVILKYGGADGTPHTSLIHLEAAIHWVEVDTQAPAFQELSAGGRPLGAAPVTVAAADGDAKITAAADDNTGVSTVSVAVDGADAPLGADGATAPLRDGVHDVTARACDIAAPPNCTAASGRVTVDTGVPRVAVSGPLATEAERPRVVVDAVDPLVDGFRTGLVDARLLLGGQPAGATAEPLPGGYALTLADPLAEGRYDLDVQVRDAAGNTGSAADGRSADAPPLELVVDRTPPTAAPGTPAPGARLRRGPLQLAVRASDTVGLRDVRLALDGADVPADPGDEGEYVADLDAPCPGGHAVTATATDLAGHAAAAAWRFTVAGRLAGRCARIACARAGRTSARLRREARRDLVLRRAALARARRAHGAARRHHRAVAARWARERRADLRRLAAARRAARAACRAARRR